MYIYKEDCKTLHKARIPCIRWCNEETSKPTLCNTSGWANRWMIGRVNLLSQGFKFCKVCYPKGED